MIKGRYTARMDEPFVVFVIGMRINRFLVFKKWVSAGSRVTVRGRRLTQGKDPAVPE